MAVYESGAEKDANKNKDWVSWNICNTGFWEDPDISKFGPPGSMLDIGGNVGFHTFAFAHAGWTVNTFEPMAPNLALQKATMCANPAIAAKVTIHPHGLGTSPQTCQMVAPKNNLGDGFTKCGAAGEVPTPDFKFQVIGTFDVKRLDGVLQEKAISKVDLVKIDVEGYEAQVFAGAPNFLAQFHPRLIKSEVWGAMTGSTGLEYLTKFQNAGYGFFMDAGCTKPHPATTSAVGDIIMCLSPQPAAPVLAAAVPPAVAPAVPPAVPPAAPVPPAQPALIAAVPAQPAVPAVPAQPAVPAVPVQPAVPAAPTR